MHFFSLCLISFKRLKGKNTLWLGEEYCGFVLYGPAKGQHQGLTMGWAIGEMGMREGKEEGERERETNWQYGTDGRRKGRKVKRRVGLETRTRQTHPIMREQLDLSWDDVRGWCRAMECRPDSLPEQTFLERTCDEERGGGRGRVRNVS